MVCARGWALLAKKGEGVREARQVRAAHDVFSVVYAPEVAFRLFSQGLALWWRFQAIKLTHKTGWFK